MPRSYKPLRDGPLPRTAAFGETSNLANIRTEDVLTLESFRRGLKEHTLTTWLAHPSP